MKSEFASTSVMKYQPRNCTNRPPTPPHCCMNRHANMPMFASCMPNCAACAAMKSWSRVASRGLLGSLPLPTPSLVRKSVQPVAPTNISPPSAIARYRLMGVILVRSAIQVDGEHVRARLWHVEVVVATRVLNRAAQIGLRVVGRVVGPGLQVPARDPHVEAL